jgi:hypothetical protein
MPLKLFFFTGTGNSLHIARSLKDLLPDCELVSIAREWKKEELFFVAVDKEK